MSRTLLRGRAWELAPLFLGAIIESAVGGQLVRLRLTEVEAYGGEGEDPGSHAYRRRTPRNETMFADAGTLYCYFTYGMHWCANVVTGGRDEAGAVLLRAGEVTSGIEVARSRRPGSSDRDLARGPARLAKVMGMTGEVDGVDVLSRTSPIRLRLRPAVPLGDIGISPRTGVGGPGAPTPWRFYLLDDPTVSPFRPAKR